MNTAYCVNKTRQMTLSGFCQTVLGKSMVCFGIGVIYIYIYTYICFGQWIIYIYIERERERDQFMNKSNVLVMNTSNVLPLGGTQAPTVGTTPWMPDLAAK